MASTATASRLTEAHRLGQAKIGAETVREMRTIWPLLSLEDLDGSFERWLRAAIPIIGRQNAASSALAARYLRSFRAIELPTATAVAPTLAGPPAADAVATSLLVTGPATARDALARGILPDRALSLAESRSARAAYRHTLAGGRGTITRSVASDRRALGWARVTSGKACAFCAMLASRGPAYSEATVAFEAHDACSCSAEPVYRELGRSEWPSGSEQYRELWEESTAGYPTGQQFSAFRAALEGREPPPL